MNLKTYYRNRLPHYAPIGATFFVTFRLADSLPIAIITKLKDELKIRIRQLSTEKPDGYQTLIENEKKKFFEKYDFQLDQKPYGQCYLKDPNIAGIVQARLHELDNKFYELIAYCVMPNHVHVLFDNSFQITDEEGFYLDKVPEDFKQLHDIMKLIKGNTAYYINKYLKRKGKLWQKDSFDRFTRDEKELYSTINYIIKNPVSAGLVKHWKDWPYTYLHPDFK